MIRRNTTAASGFPIARVVDMRSHFYAAVLSVGAEVESVTSCPAIANARTGFRLSTIELGIRIDRAPFIVTGDVQR
ncbi:hypothetical protein WS66_08175 [Burkholderia sp. LA-2-3-30-S1-D2]|nr:hypothetical protein WS66_08175 [Burkholderia sp. LA-2-3-30-S1-D2]KVE19184.1 hypothetical protein WS66_28505 [Burkholderia sp. LA-2-3-30-S1-D2]